MSIKRIFIPGEEWLYIKLYCGFKISDEILIHIVKPLTDDLIKEGFIDKWFFIRYSDPQSHLRVRLHLTALKMLSEIVQRFNSRIKHYLDHHHIWNIEYSTYKRELERYGNLNMKNSEKLFYHDSEYIIDNIITHNEDSLRFIKLLQYIDYILESFELNAKKKIEFLDKMQATFKKEFDINGKTITELNKKYDLLSIDLTIKIIDTPNSLQLIIAKIIDLNNSGQLSISLNRLIASYIHMSINRSFSSNQRLYELMVYDYLYKIMNSNLARYGRQ